MRRIIPMPFETLVKTYLYVNSILLEYGHRLTFGIFYYVVLR